jgi:hypothetical protein
MRSLLTFVVLAALTLPAASAARNQGAADGTVSVRDARGTITISARGGVIGSFARGSVTITDPVDGDGTGPIVSGNNWAKERDAATTTWGGAKVRFRILGGFFRIVVKGRGINLSLVGTGKVTLAGAATGDDGSYSVNGADYLALPGFAYAFPLSSTSP